MNATVKKLMRELPVRYIPNGFEIEHQDENIQIYYGDKNGRPAILAYTTRARRPCVYEYSRSTETRDAKKEQLIQWQINKKENVKKRRIERSQKHNLKIGDILMASWGYEQTNIDYFQVVDRTDRTVTVREIAKKITGYDTDMSGQCIAVKDAFLKPMHDSDDRGAPLRRVVSTWEWGASIKVDECRTAHLWDGTPDSWSSWY